MSYGEWTDADNDPKLGTPSHAIELNSIAHQSDTNSEVNHSNINLIEETNNIPRSNTNLIEETHNIPRRIIRPKSERMSVKFARMRTRGNQLREMENRVEDGEDDATELPSTNNTLRIIKIVALLLIGACALVAMVFSKITFVSITSQMYELYKGTEARNDEKSVIFFQLVFILVIPEILCLAHSLIHGCIGKTSKTFPWPCWKAMFLGVITSVFEVVAVCGFVFGVACRLPPSLTILLLCGVFWVVIGRHFFVEIFYKRIVRRTEYADIDDDDDGVCAVFCKRKLVPLLECMAFLMQLGTLIAIPILLAQTEDGYDNADKFMSLYILIPVTLTIMSIVWSGWIQKYLVEPKVKRLTVQGKECVARLKSAMINSFVKIIVIPFVAYGYADLLLDFNLTFSADNFQWTGSLELGAFLTNILVSFVAYLLLWMACALQSWAFFIPMLLSTPISFVWYVGSAEVDKVFPFIDHYFVDWNLRYLVLVVASLLWISQILAFGYYVFQSSDSVLANDADLFWTPCYNGAFLEQHVLLNRKTAITGYYEEEITSEPYKLRSIAKDSHIFICSTMYHENEVEMKQMLRSINRVATVSGSASEEYHKYESHVFFDNACSGEQLNQWVMQLLGLLEETLGIDPASSPKLLTPYGMQLKYTLRGNMPFYLHLKDNSKVRNKKRWSQVMYMNYVLNFRIKHSRIPKDKAFILTTDADIDFTSDDVVALLDFLARDDGVGAVCARTHPLGSGPVVWYQIFDYAVGHWFQKAAEHILGCVLCCPGCFSVFRVSAIEQVLSTYSGSVENGFDFLTKDMGEDRWLCTLLIQAGWRLEYAAVSQDSTFCPETFEEFYKQRRRWIPSTVANLALVISSYTKITSNNDSISIMFIMYQFLLVFSTLISPATVILIMVTGLTALDEDLDEVALIVILCVISVLYGAVCVYATEKTQIDVAKLLTLIFVIIMAIVFSGILTNTISSAIEGDPGDDENDNSNGTSDNFRFPVDVTSIYLGMFAATFLFAGIFHINEFMCLFHFIWYLICLPSGYLFLTIYSASNINNRSWGTREGASPKSGSGSDSWVDYFVAKWHVVLGFFWKCIGWKPRSKVDDTPPPPPAKKEHIVSELIPEPKLSKDVEEWLGLIECEMYAENFEKEGYTELDFIATMKMGDIKAIGVDKRGYQLKFEKEVKKLNTPEVSSGVPCNVLVWLDSIKLGQYKALFRAEGYSTGEDVENLKGLTRKDLESIGITRRAHLNQLMKRLRYLQYPTDIEIQTNKTRTKVEKALTLHLSEIDDPDKKLEYLFWERLAENTLKPESANLGKVEELKEKLKNLRNLALLVLLLSNIMWIVFLYTLVFPELTDYNLPDRAFSLLFLAIFSVIILIQFVAMLFHRFVTLVHLLARTKLKNKTLEANWFQPSDVDTLSRAHFVS